MFYFDISKDHFYDGLDRFAQFFIKPLMKPDSVDREIKAVDSGELRCNAAIHFDLRLIRVNSLAPGKF